jgi:hypothetical protein
MKCQWRRMAILGVLLFSLTGCWDQRPIEDRAVAIAVAVSRADQWAFVFPNVAVTVSNLGQIPPGQEFYALAVRAPTWPEALRRLQTRMSRQVSLGELQLLVVDKGLSHAAVTRIIDDMNTDGSVPATFWVAAAAKPIAIVQLTSPQSIVPYYILSQYFDCTACHALTMGEHAWQWWADDGTPGDTPYLPLIEGRPDSFTVRQWMVYATDGPPTAAPPPITEGMAYLLGRVHAAVLSVKVHGMPFELDRVQASVRESSHLTPRAVIARIRIQVKGNIGDTPPHEVLTRKLEQVIDRAASARLTQLCAEAIDWTNRHHADPYGFGKRAAWRDNELGEEMSSATLSELPVRAHIDVEVHVQGEGVMR